MLPIVPARTDKESTGVKPLPGRGGEDNLAWLERASEKLRSEFARVLKKQELIRLVLLGGVNPVSFRLRVAQAHIRHDLTPSNWSHVALLSPKESSRVFEISVEPAGGFQYPVSTNGLQSGSVVSYRNRMVYPNIALIGIPSGDKLTWGEIERAMKLFRKQRTALDAIELIVRWLAFVWGAGRAGNPLLEGFGIPSSAMLETIFSALGHDLTPGLESRSSCPEAIWQGVKWWHDYYAQAGRTQPHCYHRVEHDLIPATIEETRTERPTPSSPPTRVSTPTRKRPESRKPTPSEKKWWEGMPTSFDLDSASSLPI